MILTVQEIITCHRKIYGRGYASESRLDRLLSSLLGHYTNGVSLTKNELNKKIKLEAIVRTMILLRLYYLDFIWFTTGWSLPQVEDYLQNLSL